MGEASQPGMIGKGTGATTTVFTSGESDCKKKTVVWKIKHLAEFLEMSNEELAKNGVTFEAGDCVRSDGTRSPATWKYVFKQTKADDVDWIGGYLHFKTEDKSKVKSARAWYSATLCSGGKTISIYKLVERREFASSGWGSNEVIRKSELLKKTKGTDELEITLNVRAFPNYDFMPKLQGPRSSPSEVAQLREQANSDFGRLLESGDGADVEIKVPKEVGGEVQVDEFSYTKEAHKGILMTRSTVFAKMFAKESTMIEAKTGKVVIKDLSPKGLDIFLHYIYTGEILQDWTEVLPEILNAADKYDCAKLKQFCGHNLLPAVTTTNALKMFRLAKLHNLSFAGKGIMEFIHKNAKAIITESVIDQGFENIEGE